MQRIIRNLALLAAGVLLGTTLGVSQVVSAARSPSSNLPLEELRTFTEVFAKIKNDYVETIDDRVLLQNAIKGMLAGLDPHSAYLIPDDYKDLQAGTTGEFGGLGIEVSMEDGFVKVVSPIDETPAKRAGVQAGDMIIRLDDTPVKGMALADAVKLMRGKPGTDITITVVRDGTDKPIEFTITRDVIQVASVRSRTLEDGYGYVRVSQFQSRTGENLRDTIDKLKAENGGSLKGMVLDLRDNPGGVLGAAVSVSDAFLEEGIIVYTEGRQEDARLKFSAKSSDVLDNAPLIVLVNIGSASASEIVAGALQDHKRAVIMGSKTFGKGSVQTILPMDNGSALKLTTARYFTPSGRSIQASGIEPDITVENYRLSRVESSGIDRIKEANLSRHLKGANEKKAEPDQPVPTASEQAPDASKQALAERDFVLYEALNLLKGLDILGARS